MRTIFILGIALTLLVGGTLGARVFEAPHPSSIPHSITETLTAQIGNVTGNLLACVGSGHATLSLRQDYRDQLTVVQQEIDFGAVRFHAILDDDMSTFLNGEANMFNVFRFVKSKSILRDVEIFSSKFN